MANEKVLDMDMNINEGDQTQNMRNDQDALNTGRRPKSTTPSKHSKTTADKEIQKYSPQLKHVQLTGRPQTTALLVINNSLADPTFPCPICTNTVTFGVVAPFADATVKDASFTNPAALARVLEEWHTPMDDPTTHFTRFTAYLTMAENATIIPQEKYLVEALRQFLATCPHRRTILENTAKRAFLYTISGIKAQNIKEDRYGHAMELVRSELLPRMVCDKPVVCVGGAVAEVVASVAGYSYYSAFGFHNIQKLLETLTFTRTVQTVMVFLDLPDEFGQEELIHFLDGIADELQQSPHVVSVIVAPIYTPQTDQVHAQFMKIFREAKECWADDEILFAGAADGYDGQQDLVYFCGPHPLHHDTTAVSSQGNITGTGARRLLHQLQHYYPALNIHVSQPQTVGRVARRNTPSVRIGPYNINQRSVFKH